MHMYLILYVLPTIKWPCVIYELGGKLVKWPSWRNFPKKWRGSLWRVNEQSRSGISEILSNFQGNGSGSDRTRCGCSRKRQHRMVPKLIWRTKGQSKKIAKKVKDVCNLTDLVTQSALIKKYELNGWIAALTKKHLKGRLSQLEKYEDAWNKIIFSDET